MSKSLIQYIIRWECTTPIYVIIMGYFTARYGYTISAIMANFVGALLFYNVDKWIFKKRVEREEKYYARINKVE